MRTGTQYATGKLDAGEVILRHLRSVGAFNGRWLVAVALAISLCLGAAPAAGARAAQPAFEGAYTSFPDYMDPQLSYSAEGWTAMYDVYIPLLTYRHAAGKAGAEVIPGLAKALPKIGDAGRTYTLFLRPGLRYSDGTRVRASDFKYTVERMFRVNSGGSPFYTDIVGARSFARHESLHIGGIVTDDHTGKIVIHLEYRSGTFTNELALLFVAPVPPSTPMRDQSFNPPPSTGPYVITKASPRGWSYARNPEWRKADGRRMRQIPSGHVGRIKVTVMRNQDTQVRELKAGRLDWLFDPPPGNRTAEIEAGIDGTQLRVEPTLSTYYFWLNTQKAPFDDLKVRRAVNYAVDPEALSRVYDDQTTPTSQILPPDMPGYRKFDLYPHNMKVARRLIREADPADRDITVWVDGESPNDDAGVYYQGVLKELGFHPTLKILNPDNYFTVIGSRQTADLDTGFADWFEDYPHPNDFFEPLVASKPLPFLNENFSQLVAANLNRKAHELARRPGPIDEAAYAKLDREYMNLAPIVPFGTRTLAMAVSRAVDLHDFVWNPTFEADLTSFRLKGSPHD
jgi:peptide/nickel transport system substrate-binding protein